LVSFTEAYISAAMGLCEGDFAEEINQTITFVDGQLGENSVNAVPVPPSLILLGSGLLGLGLAKLRRQSKAGNYFM
jgi:hypothetical protein